MNNGEMPASPQSAAISPAGDVYDSESNGGSGLTKREQFAAMAMQGLISRTTLVVCSKGLSDVAVAVADALLEELNK